MSELKTIARQQMLSTKSAFDNAQTFVQEAAWAWSEIEREKELALICLDNPNTVANLMRDLARLGVSLNPSLGHAYVAVRGKEIGLDITYQGLMELAISSGIINFLQTEVVYPSDETFLMNGPSKAPTHQFDPRARNENVKDFTHVYCVCHMADSDAVITTLMTNADVEAISDYAQNPAIWDAFYLEMAKKSVIKRAVKTLPQLGALKEAIAYLNQFERVQLTKAKSKPASKPKAKTKAGENKSPVDVKAAVKDAKRQTTIEAEVESVETGYLDKLIARAKSTHRSDAHAKAKDYFLRELKGESQAYALSALDKAFA